MNEYLVIKALHIISFTAWMAGMFYLPRLFVYHTRAIPGGESDKMLQIMERKLLRMIINPAMIATFIFGIWLITITPDLMKMGWLHTKFTALFLLTAYHGMLARWRKDFVNGTNRHSEKFFRFMNEVPTVLLIIIVGLAVIKPF